MTKLDALIYGAGALGAASLACLWLAYRWATK